TLPGVISATIARHSPISGHSSSGNFSLQGITPPPGKDFDVFRVQVGPRFFETVGIPLLLGRPIDTRDTPSAPSVAVVSESFVKEFLPNQNPIGRRFSLGSPFRPSGIEIVGVAADSKYYTLRDKPKPMAFFAGGQGGSREPYLGEMLIRTSRDPGAAAAQVRQAIRSVDSRLTVLNVTTLEAQVSDALSQEALMSKFCGFFGLLALVLAAIGLYGTLAYAVARRTNEIGIRMALGARRADVLWMVLRQSVILVAFGLAIGLPLALVSTRWIRSYLFGVSPTDPLGIGAPILLLTAVSALAAYLPARRATKVDPMVALRYE
ncbi:MAG TPA: FtsX-like permease family protein, partial [Bryobacteraceae bacterium]|nr:FtsX-like permease family protein [Bryobacteraceae bacterium]